MPSSERDASAEVDQTRSKNVVGVLQLLTSCFVFSFLLSLSRAAVGAQEEILSSVVSSWARVQRVGDGLGSVHSVTKQLHQLEREVDRYAQQQRQPQSASVSQAHTFARPY